FWNSGSVEKSQAMTQSPLPSRAAPAKVPAAKSTVRIEERTGSPATGGDRQRPIATRRRQGRLTSTAGKEDAVVATSLLAADELIAARYQMAISLGFHIVLACFGVAFPTMIYVAHRRGIHRDDPDALLLARKWSKVAAVLFAV